MEFRVGIIVNDSDQLVFGNTVVQGFPPTHIVVFEPMITLKYPRRVSPKISKKEPIPYLGTTSANNWVHEGIDLPFFTPMSSSKSETPTRERKEREDTSSHFFIAHTTTHGVVYVVARSSNCCCDS